MSARRRCAPFPAPTSRASWARWSRGAGLRLQLASARMRRTGPLQNGPKSGNGEGFMHRHFCLGAVAAGIVLAAGLSVARSAPLMIVGNDEKILWDDQGKPILSPPGKDSVLIVDLANPLDPKIVANLPLKNSIVGPPV